MCDANSLKFLTNQKQKNLSIFFKQILSLFCLCFYSKFRISLYIDDKECGTLRLSRKVNNVQAPKNGGLYIGGYPSNFEPVEELETKQAFNGTIKDLVFNRRLMDLNRKIFLNSTLIF